MGVVADSRIPSMLYIDSSGNVVETTSGFQNVAILEEKLVNLLSSG
jgi:hypothetical protein